MVLFALSPLSVSQYVCPFYRLTLWVSPFPPPLLLTPEFRPPSYWSLNQLLTSFHASSLTCLLPPKDLSTANGLKIYPSLDPLMTPHWFLIKARNSLIWHKYKTLHNLAPLPTPFFLTECPHFAFCAPASLKFSNSTMISVLQSFLLLVLQAWLPSLQHWTFSVKLSLDSLVWQWCYTFMLP